MKAVYVAAGACALILSGCESTSDYYYPDQSHTSDSYCDDGGRVTRHSGVSGGQGYVYFVNHSSQSVTAFVDYADGRSDGSDFMDYSDGVEPGKTSKTWYHAPNADYSTRMICSQDLWNALGS
ncbi:MAG: hypothetical protein CME84_08505 [Henriciella sp.]|jgi:hypothetical protein|uniref:hypothetical protein n=1 Tax=Henriciella sp. TaxID=1968823 RepID=UPI000C0FADD7|nr:hypothetical protein [Henriciella sp.]MAN74109.1 hypothetical protein [Henriciella sp.]MBF34235.1 hypothetical protein [Hyphomonadaceae bacterium]PHR75585.1 MAG: hypothetical protein COA64_11815 [Henriciella sp.]|tara:strand:- start:751 stop:1119 length:369 start_codon:yes stop_codon:yes gene_type:complete